MTTQTFAVRWIGVTLLAVCAAQSIGNVASAGETASTLELFLNDDTFAVAHLDLANLSISNDEGSVVKLLSAFGLEPPVSQLAIHGVTAGVNTLRSAGVDHVFAIVGLGDIADKHGPLVVFHLKSDADSKAVENLFAQMQKILDSLGPNVPKCTAKIRGLRTIVVGSELTVARYDSLRPTKRDDLVGPLEKTADARAELSGVFSPGPDFRRVVRELWPEMPPPLTPLKGELADRWLRLEFSAKVKPTLSAALTLQAADAESAALFAELLRALPAASEQVTELDEKRRRELRQMIQTIVDTAPPRVEGTRVVMQLPGDESQFAKLQGLVGDATNAVMESTYRNQRMQQFKHMAIAMHVYADKYKHLPPPAIRDKDGKPLLSWRVAILPFVEEGELFKQFHLHEPWDSPHNRELAKKMPSVYADPDPKIKTAMGDGKTSFVVPVAPGTVFDTKEGSPIRDIKDGTSNTIMILEVAPDRAVEWTKPADWNVDLDHANSGVERSDRDTFATAYCDGSARILRTDMKPDALRAALTQDGHEIVDGP